MAEAQGLRKTDRVVRPITAAGGRTCARPGCPAPARATLTFAYEAREARLVGLLPEIDPAAYDLCTGHADRTSPPFGWSMSDQRPPDSEDRPLDLADEDRTVAVISAALRAVPNPPAAAAPAPVEVAEVVVDAQPATTPVLTAAPAVEPDLDVEALVEAVEEISEAEVQVALAELSEIDAVAASRPRPRPVPAAAPVQGDEVTAVADEPEVWSAEVDGEGTTELLSLTLPFDADAEAEAPAANELDDEDEYDEDAPLTPEGHAQVW